MEAKKYIRRVTYKNYKMLEDNPLFFNIRLGSRKSYLRRIQKWCYKEFIEFIKIYGYKYTSEVTGVPEATLKYRKGFASKILHRKNIIKTKCRLDTEHYKEVRRKHYLRIKYLIFANEKYVYRPKEKRKIKAFINKYSLKELSQLSNKSENEILTHLNKRRTYIERILRANEKKK